MPDTGPLTADSFSTDSNVPLQPGFNGTVDWLTPTNAISSNDLYATATTSGDLGEHSNYLIAQDFDFAIPAGSTINGIVATFERRGASGDHVDNSIRLVKGGTISGDDKADLVTAWPSVDTARSYGSSSDLWGLSWAATDITASSFGVAISVWDTLGAGSRTARIDVITMTVTYSAAAANSTNLFMAYFKRLFPKLWEKLFLKKQTRSPRLNPILI
jgi:hypothetical protein